MTLDLLLLWKIQLAPLAAFLIIQVLPKSAKKFAPAVGVLGAFSAAASSVWLLLRHASTHDMPVQYVHHWLSVSDASLWPFVEIKHYSFVVGFLLDELNLLMITLVTTISFFVQLFSVYYMAEDDSKPRYFCFLSFFSFAMTGLVLSNNLLQTFLFWELVGLASYMLIGFWFGKPSAATAARKAFVINRLADLGFYLGIILLFMLFGTLNFVDLKADTLRAALPQATVTVLGILVLLGVMGKSAQFPFHVWLPDAMEGPTPVSALIHSATMVAAGVFLLARNYGLFAASDTTLWVILTVGALTALVGAALGTVQRDIKRIMAYSTVSQLGFMVMAMGAGSSVAGMFHLSTHAYFKSLLFLTSGAFIHHFHTNDIWEIGQKGGKRDTLSVAVLCLGLFSLCGIFPFSGFFSKDMILEAIKEKSGLFYAAALTASLLTAYYSFRLLFVILFSKEKHAPASPAGRHHDAHHEPAVLSLSRAVPLVSLAALSLFVGALGTPLGGDRILHWLGGHASHTDPEILFTTLGLVIAGAGVAYWQFRDPEQALIKFESRRDPLKVLLLNKFYIDDAYTFLVKRVGLGIAAVLDWFDRNLINGFMVNGTSYRVLDIGKVVSRLQNGLLQDYLSVALAIGVAVIFYLIYFMRG